MTDKRRDQKRRRDPYFSDPDDGNRRPPEDPDFRYREERQYRDDRRPSQPYRDDSARLREYPPHTRAGSPPAPQRDSDRTRRRQDHHADAGYIPDSRHPNYDDADGSRYRGSHENTLQQHYPIRFHGKTGEYFKIWIVNIFLTIITLYIYSAWAKVRTKRYFYGNTTIDGSSFEYHATGKQLVVGRVIAAILLITYTVFQDINVTVSLTALGLLAVLFPWALWRSLKFNAKASSFRNIRLGFDGGATTPYRIFFAVPVLLAIVTAAAYLLNQKNGLIDFEQSALELMQQIAPYAKWILAGFPLLILLIVPGLHRHLISYSHNNHRYGVAEFSAKISTGRIYGIYFVAALLLIGAFILGALVMFGLFNYLDKINSDILIQLQTNQSLVWRIITAALGYAFIIGTTGLSVAYFKSAIRNHRYNATRIDSRLSIQSKTKTGYLWWLNTSNLLMIIFTLGLAYPYTKIRTARYFASCTSLSVAGGLNAFTDREQSKLRAMGEEMADAFDVEFDIGI